MAEGTAPVVIAVTLDTSFYIGALNSRGHGSRVLGMARAGEIRIDISDAILAETIKGAAREICMGWVPAA